jgi:hypothetical protein
MNRSHLYIPALVLALAAGCVSNGPSDNYAELKPEAERLGAKADGQDLCELYGWYDDAVCDEFCPEPDPDCGAVVSSECEELCSGSRVSRGCFRDDECIEFCENELAGQGEEAEAAFAQCLDTNPLCYQSPQECIDWLTNRSSDFDCEVVCDARPRSGCFSRSSCVDFCESEIADANSQIQSSFTGCLDTPLCYETAQDCIDRTLP